MPKTLICPYCHSHDIVIDACASWNTKAQEWQLSSTHDVMSCEKCGQEFREADEMAAPEPEPDDSLATSEEINRAVSEYAEEGRIEFDGDAKASRADEGVWVSAWVWLSNED